MKKLIFVVGLLGLFGFGMLFNPQSKKITARYFPDFDVSIPTPAFQKSKGFTNYKEMIVFLENQKNTHPDILSITYLGESQKGKNIPLVTLHRKNEKADKIRVWLQGGIHGDEPASTEGMLYLIEQLLHNTKYGHLLDNLEIQILPMANIDGYEKQIREAANGMDLNRDQTKLAALESIILKQAFSDFAPHVALDFHEFRPYRKDFAKFGKAGITSIHDVMFLYSGNLNVPPSLRAYTQNTFVANAKKALDNYKLLHHDYITSDEVHGDVHFNQGAVSARSSATSYALTNAVSTLIEVRGVGIGKLSFNRRVYSTFLTALSYIETAYSEGENLKKEILQAQAYTGDVVPVTKKLVYKKPLQVIDLHSNEPVELLVTIRDALQSSPVLTRTRPFAYIIHKSNTAVVQKLKTLGLKMETLQNAKKIEVEEYTVSEYTKSPYKFEKVYIQGVTTKVALKNINFDEGTFIVYMNQRNANLAADVLEPEGANSFVSFSVIRTSKENVLPIYRYLKTEKL